jgi:hypothetical protein
MISKLIHKIVALVFFLLALAGLALAQSSDRAYRVDTFSTSGSPQVHVSTSGGSINVIGHAENEVIIEMFVRRGSSYLSTRDTDLSDFDITIRKDGDNVVAEARRKRSGIFSGPRNISISFRVHAPQYAIVDGQTSGGSVSAENLFNGIKLATSGGSVRVSEAEGEIDLSTSGGSIAVDKVSGIIMARTSGGSITANDVYGEAEFRTSGGSIRLENISARISARTSGGSIRGSFNTFMDDIELQTSGGSIRVNLPDSDHFDLELRGNRVDMQLRNFSGEVQRNSIRGKIGEGGPLLTARTSGGTVTVR